MKLQTPTTKLQRSSKVQIPKGSSDAELKLEAWNFSGAWILELGDFPLTLLLFRSAFSTFNRQLSTRPPLLLDLVHKEQLLSDPFQFLQTQLRTLRDLCDSNSICHRRRIAPAKNQRTNCLIDLIYQPLAEESGVNFTPALAEQAFYVPFFAQPMQRFGKIQFLFSEDFHLIGNPSKLFQPPFGRQPGHEHDHGRKTTLENLGAGIEGT